MAKKKVVLIILDGWGIGPKYAGNAIDLAQTPVMNQLWAGFPKTQLVASGEAVGLPKGEDGNTETGHLNIGAGRIVYQDLPRINMSIANGSFFNNQAFLRASDHVKTHSSNLHIIGLVGSGGVHSSNQHLFALLRYCQTKNITNVYLHLITDGRDSPPSSALNYIEQINQVISETGVGKIATVVGRYYAMDRDNRWDRTKVAYDALVDGVGQQYEKIDLAIAESYKNNATDEFIKPVILTETGKSLPRITDHDAVIFFNYRVDRPRQLTKAFVLSDDQIAKLKDSFDPYAVKYHKSHLVESQATPPVFRRSRLLNNLLFITMTEYEKHLPVEIAFPPETVQMPLSRVIALNGKRQLKMAESEKERFVTYYFNGQREAPFPGEDVLITPSPKVATYDLEPEMSALEQTAKLIAAMQKDFYDLIVINYANPDMVAHTGNLQATIKACEFTDKMIGKIYQASLSSNSTLLITADHGNAEELINLETGDVDTEHSDLPVPLIIVDKELVGKHTTLPRGILGDIAPTILRILNIEKPAGMTGRSLI